MKSDIIWPMSLKFKDPGLEKEFDRYKQQGQRSKFPIIIFGICGLSIHSFFSEKHPEDITFFREGVAVIAAILFYTLVYKITLKWFSGYKETVLMLIILESIIIPSEMEKSKWSKTVYFTCGSSIQLFACLCLLFHVSFKKNLLMIPICTLYPVWRFASPEEIKESHFYSNNAAILNSFVLLSLNYFSEKQYRLSFYEQFSYQISLENFKHVMKSYIPHGILIVREGKIIFSNEACKELFDPQLLEDDGSKQKLLEAIRIDKEEIVEETNENNEMGEDSGVNNIKDVLNCVDRQAEDKSGSQKEEQKNSLGQFTSYSGNYKKSKIVRDENSSSFTTSKKMVPLDLLVGKLKWDNESAYMIVVSDISAKKRVQFLKELSKYKDRLLATVSHDLRTPLNGVIGILEILHENNSEEGQAKLLQICIRSANLLLYMINDILDFSQISNGKLRLNINKVDNLGFVKDIVKIIKFQAKKKGIALNFESEVDFSNEPHFYSDVNRVKQVLLNLLSNALKFTIVGSITLKIYPSVIEAKRAIFFQVTDTGIGIRKEDQPKLFKLFGKLEQKRKDINAGGVGLGLAISQNLVKMLCGNEAGGEISVKSEVGIGSEFKFPLFLRERNSNSEPDEVQSVEVPDECSNKKEARASSARPSKRLETRTKLKTLGDDGSFAARNNHKINVLIVDDDPINVLVASKFVQSFGDYCYETANNGKEALEKLCHFSKTGVYFDIVLMDCNMPVMDGFEASNKITELIKRNELKSLIIVAVTANTADEDRKICERAGMSHFLAKPVIKSELESKLKSISKLVQKERASFSKTV